MDKITRNALVLSIKKWRRNAEVNDPENYTTGDDSCPLCNLYLGYNCFGCPVAKASKKSWCEGTPYFKALYAKALWKDSLDEKQSEDIQELKKSAHEAAEREADFLAALLPAEEPVQ